MQTVLLWYQALMTIVLTWILISQLNTILNPDSYAKPCMEIPAIIRMQNGKYSISVNKVGNNKYLSTGVFYDTLAEAHKAKWEYEYTTLGIDNYFIGERISSQEFIDSNIPKEAPEWLKNT